MKGRQVVRQGQEIVLGQHHDEPAIQVAVRERSGRGGQHPEHLRMCRKAESDVLAQLRVLMLPGGRDELGQQLFARRCAIVGKRYRDEEPTRADARDLPNHGSPVSARHVLEYVDAGHEGKRSIGERELSGISAAVATGRGEGRA